MNKSVVRLIVLLIVGAALIAGVLVFKGAQKDAAADKLLSELLTDLAAAELDDAGHAYVAALARRYHGDAAAAAFNSGGDLTGGTYDVNRYQLLLVNRIAEHARSDGSTHIALKLEAFKARATLELNDPAGMPGGS